MPKKCCTSVSVDLAIGKGTGKDGKPSKDGTVLVITGQMKMPMHLMKLKLSMH